MLTDSKYSVEVWNASDVRELMEYFHKLLPFSVNMMAAVSDYPERCTVLVARGNNEIEGSLVEFNSEYNGHIWFNPIRWVSGNAEVASLLVKKVGIRPSVTISESDFSFLFDHSDIPVSVFEEFIMTTGYGGSNPQFFEDDWQIRRMTVDDAMDSLVFSGYKTSELNSVTLERERRFLSERTCLGLFIDGKLASRGSIMSTTPEFSSLGAFRTDESLRKQGFGSRIILSTLKKAQSVSRSACLFVSSTNTAAINIYSKLGFEVKKGVFFTDIGTGLIP